MNDLPVVSTCGHFICTQERTIKHTRIHNQPEYDLPNILENKSLIPGLQIKNKPSELVIFVHGIWNSEKKLQINLLKLKKSLVHNNYFHPLIGFSWDSKVSGLNYSDLKKISNMNGIKLAKFIIDYKHVCKKTRIRLIGHSLGSNIILNALPFINPYSKSPNSEIKIRSIHLLGGAIENDLVSKKNNLGYYIENKVDKFFNFYNNNDSVLKTTRKLHRLNNPIGLVGTKSISNDLPLNFYERNVTEKLIEFKMNRGKPKQFEIDHSSYFGIVDEYNNLIFDGVINILIQDWNKQEQKSNLDNSMD